MPRPRKPTALKVLDGSIRDHPGRQNSNEPDGDSPLGDPPSWMPGAKQEIWREIVGNFHEGVACSADRVSLELIVDLLYRHRLAPVDEPGLSGAELSRLSALLIEFGMTPASRSRVSARPKQASNPFADL